MSDAPLWQGGEAYEAYVGRWSRAVAREFVPWLGVPEAASWLDVGCGTGALSETILGVASPREVAGIDQSAAFIGHARARFATGDATALPLETGAFDAAVSGLVLNFVPEPARMVEEMARAVRAGGVVGLYVWDYAGEMQVLRRFWDAAPAADPRLLPTAGSALTAAPPAAGAASVTTRGAAISTMGAGAAAANRSSSPSTIRVPVWKSVEMRSRAIGPEPPPDEVAITSPPRGGPPAYSFQPPWEPLPPPFGRFEGRPPLPLPFPVCFFSPGGVSSQGSVKVELSTSGHSVNVANALPTQSFVTTSRVAPPSGAR